MRRLIALTLLCFPGALIAQGTISPGMSRAQVESALGAPVTSRTVNEHSYLFYSNSCGRSCGMHDLVILRGDSVVDAIFRSPDRRYTGQSSSPEEVRPQITRRAPEKPLPVRKEPALARRPKREAPAPPKKEVNMPQKNTSAASVKSAAKAATPGQMRPPAQANDVRPSIPLNEPKMPPGTASNASAKAPEKAPAKKDARNAKRTVTP